MPPITPSQILLLKTKSSPHDGYDEFFSAQSYSTAPTFVPVLSHNLHKENLGDIKALFESGALLPQQEEGRKRRYGGMIFTSQRAVEAFADLVGGMDGSILERSSCSLPLYTVGPATARSLSTLRDTYLPHATIHGAETGNGENLAHYILEHYNSLHPQQTEPDAEAEAKESKSNSKPHLLFLVGETRRDIIPKTLLSDPTPSEKRIGVDEVVVYETGVVEGFEADFESILLQRLYPEGNISRPPSEVVWVIVFSPTGCDAMVRVLTREMDRDAKEHQKRRVFVATIGPTTRDHLSKICGFAPDVCAAKPSPEGVGAGIEKFMKGLEGNV
ncbi:uroporphyrinogen-III synthase HEM4 [Aspergillus stella-maris]|uniref:uroporphyrinogen-III synthase HEM4 n=1 Tax=Aspergillus stella-maris TaxID=1810926 RepID=UPI003CCCC1F7